MNYKRNKKTQHVNFSRIVVASTILFQDKEIRKPKINEMRVAEFSSKKWLQYNMENAAASFCLGQIIAHRYDVCFDSLVIEKCKEFNLANIKRSLAHLAELQVMSEYLKRCVVSNKLISLRNYNLMQNDAIKVLQEHHLKLTRNVYYGRNCELNFVLGGGSIFKEWCQKKDS